MTTDLWYLALTAILTAALWIPYIACQVMTNGFLVGGKLCRPDAASGRRCGASARTAPT